MMHLTIYSTTANKLTHTWGGGGGGGGSETDGVRERDIGFNIRSVSQAHIRKKGGGGV